MRSGRRARRAGCVAGLLRVIVGGRAPVSGAQSHRIPQVRPLLSPAPGVRTILVFPFENGSRDASLDWLCEGLAELTIERLQGPRRFVLAREDRLDALERMGIPATANLSRATMITLGEAADADDVVFGRFTSDGKTISLDRKRFASCAAIAFTIVHRDGRAAGLVERSSATFRIIALCDLAGSVPVGRGAGRFFRAGASAVADGRRSPVRSWHGRRERRRPHCRSARGSSARRRIGRRRHSSWG